MSDKIEALINRHIQRLEKDIANRDQRRWDDGTRKNTLDAEFDAVDLKNIASLREGRIPQYSDHIDCLIGDQGMDMSEFADLTQEMALV